jgi:uncharacterized lipoprotein
MPSKRILSLFLVVLALAVAGCGGSSSDESAGDGQATTETSPATTGGEEDVDKGSPAYQGGYELCSQGTPAEVASLYGVDPPTTDAVAGAISEQVGGGGSEQNRVEGRQGCLDAFAAQK